jgi:hypothetical protein
MSQFLDGLGEIQMVVFNEKIDSVAVGAAAKAMVSLAGWGDGKGGGFFVMERATGQVERSRPFEGDLAIDELDYIDPCQQVAFEVGCNSAGHGVSEQMTLRRIRVVGYP